jgi:hypothetical protein
MANFQVIGEDGRTYEVGEDIMGDIMGVGRSGRRRRRGGSGGGTIRVVKPDWRNRQLAPGVQAPDEGMLSLPLQAPNRSTFDAANQNLIFSGILQKPFRGERFLVDVVRTGASATGRLLAQIFVGTDLQQVDIFRLDLEQLGTSQAFGVRQTLSPAQPGVRISVDVTLSNALLAADTIFVSAQIVGRVEH